MLVTNLEGFDIVSCIYVKNSALCKFTCLEVCVVLFCAFIHVVSVYSYRVYKVQPWIVVVCCTGMYVCMCTL